MTGLVPSDVMDPMYWLGDSGPFGAAVLPGVMIIVFIETGLLFPFLPGDTLLFTGGLIAAQDHCPFSIWQLAPCAALAAFLGSQCGYFIGRRLGPALFRTDSRFFKLEYLTTAHEYFERYGAKTLLISQFIGVVRTFVPVVAGMSSMRYAVFAPFSAIGSAAWGFGLTLVGYYLGNISFVGQHLDVIVVCIAVLSTTPAALAAARVLIARRRAAAAAAIEKS